MTYSKTRLRDYLLHIRESIARIEQYTSDHDETRFFSDQLLQDAVIRNLEIIGEASRNITRNFPEIATANSNIPFAFAYDMRNALAHGYFKVDMEIVWNTIQRDLPNLDQKVADLIADTDFSDN
ncbi:MULTISPECIES: HepT-like ribonuclease domain-containing protein [Thalassospira]|uniref:DUF86 domain-containing protein n=2 Tax=Thalassospira TaxID=168934 RepID=A0A367WCE4_9PROT|nr:MULTISPECIES: DUF86 domain-containing protein [Thalassospira]MDG4717419.1 DUF86 domain-containing protein [Thalassospira sp. FZY0004]RCK39103.1 hypothetical protein TH19_04795 [Thalassospira profundimaris]